MATISRKSRIYLIALGVYLCIVFLLSHVSPGSLAFVRPVFWDKALHFIEYIPIGFLVMGFLLHSEFRHRAIWLSVLLSALSVTILGGFDEVHQSFVPGRVMSIGDLFADFLGGLAGIFAAIIFAKVQSAKTLGIAKD